MADPIERTHTYDAEATIVQGELRQPFSQPIEPQTHSKLAPEGGYFSQRSDGYRLESIISYRNAYSQVAGNLGRKPGSGWITVSTTVVENLNVFDVLTADRVVGQMITEHPKVGYVPSISFLGTRFDNLRIQGCPVELDIDYDIVGPKPANDGSYTGDAAFVHRVSLQRERILQNPKLPAELRERYNQAIPTDGGAEAVECSLVNQASGLYPGTSCGNVIVVPGFGIITLEKLTIKHEYPAETPKVPKKTTFTLTMVDLNMGCAIDGDVPIGCGSSNGSSEP